ncbi:MAG: chloride channel protein [Dehalococcoidales bacterium]|nr:chloride channel protein [Dehalococcoidales bacterium]
MAEDGLKERIQNWYKNTFSIGTASDLGLMKSIRSHIKKLFSSETTTSLGLAVLIGVAAGLGAVGFRWLITTFNTLFFDGGSKVFSFLGEYYIIIIPALGGLLVGPIVYFLAREAKGHGVPEVMEAVAMRGGRIRPRVVLVKTLASALCIGSGGSVGREGPIVQIGSSAGSAVGQWLKLPEETVKMLVACGAASGISATFNAPIAGVLFSMEVILGRVIPHRFAYVVISSVIADVIAHSFLGNERAFIVPEFAIHSPWEIGLYAVLGILAAVAGVVFSKVLYKFEDLIDMVKFPQYLKPAVGGLLIGTMGLYSRHLFGVGYDGIQEALSGQITLGVLLLLFVMKIVATSITIGSGGSGGIFAPSLFLGAMLGTAFGIVAQNIFPDIISSPAAYGVVAMAAVFSGAARAPFSSILIIFEMTGAYSIILPVMIAVGISTVLARQISRESIYTMKLVRRGVDIGREDMIDVMRNITVKEAMTTSFPAVGLDMKVKELMKLFQTSGHHGFPVVDTDNVLQGIVTLADVERHLGNEDTSLTVGQIATKSPFVAYPEQTLDRVLTATEQDYGRIPVVNENDGGHLVGVLQRQGIIKAYQKTLRRMKKSGLK